MMISEDISIAMTTFQGEKYLKEQLDSVINQTLLPKEIVICDDGSTDGTHDIISEYSDKIGIKLYTSDKPVGVIKNFQKAISLCRYEYIALSDQDDVWVETKLEDCVGMMDRVERDSSLPTLVFSDLSVVDHNLGLISESFWKHLNANPINDTFYTILFGNVATGCASMINRSLANELNSIPAEAIMHDYWAALIAFGFGQVGIIEKPLLKYRQHTKNITDNYKRSLPNRFKDFIKFLVNDYDLFLQAELNQALAFKYRFGELLTIEHKADLERFLDLKKTSGMRRKWESYKSNRTN